MMLGCAHCETAREAVTADWEGFEMSWTRADLAPERSPAINGLWGKTAGMADCRCDCHLPARIVGKLPRLAPT